MAESKSVFRWTDECKVNIAVLDQQHRELLDILNELERALRVGDLKIVAAGADATWELYDLKTDRAESMNLAASQPERVLELGRLWTQKFEEFCDLAKK